VLDVGDAERLDLIGRAVDDRYPEFLEYHAAAALDRPRARRHVADVAARGDAEADLTLEDADAVLAPISIEKDQISSRRAWLHRHILAVSATVLIGAPCSFARHAAPPSHHRARA